MKKVLIVVDMQNDFIDGALGTKEALEIVPSVIEKIKTYENENSIIYYTMDTHFSDYLKTQEGMHLPVEHCIKDTVGWEIPKNILRDNLNIIEKYTFGSTKLFEKLSEMKDQIESIELIGLCTDICVVSNALLAKANFLDIPVYVDASCCAGVTPKSHSEALNTMKMCQINVLNY